VPCHVSKLFRRVLAEVAEDVAEMMMHWFLFVISYVTV
jgi:hypothetical protein